MNRRWLDEVDAAATAHGIDAADLVDTLLHREFCLRPDWTECLDLAVGQVRWHLDHRRAIKEQQYTGSRYDQDLSIIDIKKLVAAEVKRLGCKASLRTERHPRSLGVDLREGAEPLLTDDGRISDYGARLVNQVADFLKEYNFDRGDDWTDYICVNFYTTITVMDLPSERYTG
jgi:hypothetical protein